MQKNPGDWRDVLLLPRRQVRFLRPLALDLGGIAKGFAVDVALETLREHGVAAAIVNAGGDLRALGPQPVEVHLRHPMRPTTFAGRISVCESALATSSPCFTEREWRGRRVSHLVNPNRGASITGGVSVTVRARECWLADALTKAVLNAPRRAESLLAKYEAEAFMLRV
jgi:thiamine biosynthesis lipoprotein